MSQQIIGDRTLLILQLISLLVIMPVGVLIISYLSLPPLLYFLPMIPAVGTFYMMCNRCDWRGII